MPVFKAFFYATAEVYTEIGILSHNISTSHVFHFGQAS